MHQEQSTSWTIAKWTLVIFGSPLRRLFAAHGSDDNTSMNSLARENTATDLEALRAVRRRELDQSDRN
jgi:hypothetical protein